MLVLTRAKNESIMIGDNIEIIVADVKRMKVRLAIRAPRTVPVHRKEVYEAIMAEAGKERGIDAEEYEMDAFETANQQNVARAIILRWAAAARCVVSSAFDDSYGHKSKNFISLFRLQ